MKAKFYSLSVFQLMKTQYSNTPVLHHSMLMVKVECCQKPPNANKLKGF